MAEVPPVETLLEHAAFARRLARALVGDAARADDVVQTSWLQALQHPPREGRGMKAWLAAVVRNAAARVRREESRRDQRERRAAVPERLPATVDVAAQLAAQRALLDAVARLDEPYRSTIHARFFEERTPTAIAAASGVPVRTVETRLRRAIARLRVDLDARFEGGRAAWAGLLLGGGAVATSSKAVGVGFAAAVALAVVATTWIVQATGERSTHAAGPPAVPSASATASPLMPAADAPLPAAAVAGASPGALRESARCNVSVVTPEGVAVAGATLVQFRDDEVLGDATTDASGEATLPREADAWRLYVVPGCAPPRVVDVAAGSTSVEVALEGGAVCSGRVTVEGKAPEAPIELEFMDAEDQRAEVPDAIWYRVRKLGVVRLAQVVARTDADGGFVAFGLAAHRKFTILVPVPYEAATTAETWVQVAEAREGLEIALRRNPTIRGRLLDRMGEPLARWHIEGWLQSSAFAGNEPLATSGDDGRFHVDLHNSRSEESNSGVLYVSDPAEVFVSRVAIEHPVGDGCDVGDLAVDTARVLAIEARDPAGLAIDDFAAVLERKLHDHDMSGHGVRSLVGHDHARAGLLVPVEVASLRALAPGHGAADVPCEPATGKVTVTLDLAAQLTLDVKDGGKPLPGSILEVRSAKWPAAWTRPELAAAHEALGGSRIESENYAHPTPAAFQVRAKEDAPFRLLALVPGASIDLIVRDRIGVEVLRESVVLEPGERRVLERTVAERSADVAGFIHTADGKPVAARIEWSASGSDHADLAFAKSDGRFRLEGVRAPRIMLVVQAGGYAWKWLRDVEPAKVEGVLDIALEPGCSMSCGFCGNGDGYVKPAAVWIESAASRSNPDGDDLPPERGDRIDGIPDRGSFGFTNVPEGKQWLRARIDGFTFAIVPARESGEMTYNTMLRGPATIEWSIVRPQAGRTLKAIRLLPSGGFHHARATVSIDAAAAERGSGSVRFEKLPIDQYTVVLVWSDALEETTDVTVNTFTDTTPQVRVAR